MKKELPWYSCLDCHSLDERLRILREKEGLTQKQVANYLQLSRSLTLTMNQEKGNRAYKPFPGWRSCSIPVPITCWGVCDIEKWDMK